MSWIKEADQPDLPEIFRALSLNSQALDVVRQLNEGLAFGNSTLGRAQEEAIATVVSVANHCRYGALTHSSFLHRYSEDSGLASQMLIDYTKADLSAKDRLMLDFAVRITLEPAGLTESEIDGLRTAGFEDKDIVSIVMLTCLSNFMNRIASSLGAEVPSSLQRAVQRRVTGPASQQAWLLFPGLDEPQHQEDGPPAISTNPDPATLAIASFRVTDPGGPCSANGSEPTAVSEEEISGDADSFPFLSEHEQHLQRFLDECCTISPDEASTAKDLYIEYLRWCDQNQMGPLIQRNFGLKLSGLGFHRRRRGHGRHWWLGVGLKDRISTDRWNTEDEIRP